MNEKKIKYASIRLPPETHKAMKVRAAMEGKLMWQWIGEAITEKLEREKGK